MNTESQEYCVSKWAKAKSLKLVPLEQIPKAEEIREVPLDDLMDVFKICQKMEKVCRAEDGIGISAVQLGIPYKLFIVKGFQTKTEPQPLLSSKFSYFVNVNYVPISEKSLMSLEGCLSIRSLGGQLRHFQVPRFPVITITGHRLLFDIDLRLEKIQNLQLTVDDLSHVFQHEIDHHCGITIDQIGKELFLWQ